MTTLTAEVAYVKDRQALDRLGSRNRELCLPTVCRISVQLPIGMDGYVRFIIQYILTLRARHGRIVLKQALW